MAGRLVDLATSSHSASGLQAACFVVGLAGGCDPPAGHQQTLAFAALQAAAGGHLAGRREPLRLGETLSLEVEGLPVELSPVELRTAGGATRSGSLAPGAELLLIAGPTGGLALSRAPVVAALPFLAHAPADPGEGPFHMVSPWHWPETSLDVLLAPAGGPVARALAARRPGTPDGRLYASHAGRVYEIRVCMGGSVAGLSLRMSERLLLSLGLQGRPMVLAPCAAPPDLAVVWLETDAPIRQIDREAVLSAVAGAPLHVDEVVRFAGLRFSARVVRLMGRDLRPVSTGVAVYPGPGHTILHVQTPCGDPGDLHQLVTLQPSDPRREALLLEPMVPDRGMAATEQTLLVSAGVFRQVASSEALCQGVARFLCRGMLLDVRPGDGMRPYAIAIPTGARRALGPFGTAPLALTPAPAVAVAASVEVSFGPEAMPAGGPLPDMHRLRGDFLRAHRQTTMHLGQALPFRSGDVDLLATVRRVVWSGTPGVDRPVGLLPAEASDGCACLQVTGTGPPVSGGPESGSGPAGPGVPADAARRWLLVGDAAAGPGLLGLEASASPPEGLAPGRASVSIGDHRLLCALAAGGPDVFLQVNGHLLLVYPDPHPGGRSAAGSRIVLSQWDFGCIFGQQQVLWAAVSMAPPVVDLVEVDLSPGPAAAGPISHSALVASFRQALQGTVLSVGQAVELPTPGATLPGHISSLVDGDLRPLKAGLLAAGDTFVYMNARGAGYGVLDCPLSALIRMPLLDAYIRLPVAGAPDVDMSRVSLRRPDIRVSARTMGSLRAHFLEGRRPIFLNEDYQLRPVEDGRLRLRHNRVLLGQDLLPPAGPYSLMDTEPPEVLSVTCEVFPDGAGPRSGLDVRLLEDALLRALPPDNVIRANVYSVLLDPLDRSSRVDISVLWMEGARKNSCQLAVVVPGLTWFTFRQPRRGPEALASPGPLLAPGQPHKLVVRCNPRWMAVLRAEFIPTGTLLYGGLMLPRDVFQSLGEALGEAAPPECMALWCCSRVFLARLADTHDTPGVVRLSEDFRSHVLSYPDLGPYITHYHQPEALRLKVVHMRVEATAAGRVAAPAEGGPSRDQLQAALPAAFPDGSMVLLERRPAPGLPVTLTPELLTDGQGWQISCGFFHPAKTRVLFSGRGVAASWRLAEGARDPAAGPR
ncbi:hypothetical protein H696_05766 [Fonticula alba]|uniref:Uncharacterized protein n=1 Tax=Fonticula alba TaxID=691883 RepID=A0A058Z0Z9_FONAL|nr:hypothetical protein H696_05766 [Fonticula alba]KCV67811.1 hypothetical protein H696_05766 [Fonticula alba]|eukprot:XP_009497842.1 hypothetical protein H696_05766 [Fonticula alba]